MVQCIQSIVCSLLHLQALENLIHSCELVQTPNDYVKKKTRRNATHGFTLSLLSLSFFLIKDINSLSNCGLQRLNSEKS